MRAKKNFWQASQNQAANSFLPEDLS